MTPTPGRILHYRLCSPDVDAIMRRRTSGAGITHSGWPAGAQAHVGNPVNVGDVVPLIVVRVWPNEYGPSMAAVNGQAFLDGNDVLWVTSAKQGDEPGTWNWPPKV